MLVTVKETGDFIVLFRFQKSEVMNKITVFIVFIGKSLICLSVTELISAKWFDAEVREDALEEALYWEVYFSFKEDGISINHINLLVIKNIALNATSASIIFQVGGPECNWQQSPLTHCGCCWGTVFNSVCLGCWANSLSLKITLHFQGIFKKLIRGRRWAKLHASSTVLKSQLLLQLVNTSVVQSCEQTSQLN